MGRSSQKFCEIMCLFLGNAWKRLSTHGYWKMEKIVGTMGVFLQTMALWGHPIHLIQWEGLRQDVGNLESILYWLVVTGTMEFYDLPFSWEWWSQLTHIFFRGVGWNHQPALVLHLLPCSFLYNFEPPAENINAKRIKSHQIPLKPVLKGLVRSRSATGAYGLQLAQRQFLRCLLRQWRRCAKRARLSATGGRMGWREQMKPGRWRKSGKNRRTGWWFGTCSIFP